MGTLALIGRLVLAGVLLVSGAAKLLDRRGTLGGLREFGVPVGAAPAAAVALPLVEIVLGSALVPVASARAAAVGAAALLGTFTVAIAVNLMRGRRPECHCFGALHRAPVSAMTCVRNVGLTGLAGLVIIADPSVALPAWTVAAVGAGTYLAVHAWVTFELIRQNGRLLLRIDALEARRAPVDPLGDDLPTGVFAPPFRLSTLSGGWVSLAELLARGNAVVLVFANPGCAACDELVPELERRQRDLLGRVTLAVVSRGTPEDNASLGGLRDVALEPDFGVFEAYRAGGTPAAVLIAADGTVGRPTVRGATAISSLLADIAMETRADAGLAGLVAR